MQLNLHSPSTIPMQGKESRVAFFLSIHGLVTKTSTIKIERKKHFLISVHLSWGRTLKQGERNPSAVWQWQCIHAVGSHAGICSSAGNGQTLAYHRDGGKGSPHRGLGLGASGDLPWRADVSWDGLILATCWYQRFVRQKTWMYS